MTVLECYCKVDEWGRIIMPMPYRQRFGDRATFILIPEERYIAGGPLKTLGLPLTDESQNERNTGKITSRQLDRRGRITIPPKLREHAEIKNIVVFLATDDYFELWSEHQWDLEYAQAWAQAGAEVMASYDESHREFVRAVGMILMSHLGYDLPAAASEIKCFLELPPATRASMAKKMYDSWCIKTMLRVRKSSNHPSYSP